MANSFTCSYHVQHTKMFVRACLGTTQTHTCATLLREEVLRQSCSNRSSFWLVVRTAIVRNEFACGCLPQGAELRLVCHTCAQTAGISVPGGEGDELYPKHAMAITRDACSTLSKETENLLVDGYLHLILPALHNMLHFPCCEVKVNLEGLGMQGSSPPWLGGLRPTSPIPVRHRWLMQFPFVGLASGRAEHVHNMIHHVSCIHVSCNFPLSTCEKFTTLSVPKVSISDPITEIISILYGITDMAT